MTIHTICRLSDEVPSEEASITTNNRLRLVLLSTLDDDKSIPEIRKQGQSFLQIVLGRLFPTSDLRMKKKELRSVIAVE